MPSKIPSELLPGEKILTIIRYHLGYVLAPALFFFLIPVFPYITDMTIVYLSQYDMWQNKKDLLELMVSILFVGIQIQIFLTCGFLVVSRLFEMMTTRRFLTNYRLIVTKTFFWRGCHEINIHKIEQLKIWQNPVERLFGFGEVTLWSMNHKDSVDLFGVAKPFMLGREIDRNRSFDNISNEGVSPLKIADTLYSRP